MDNLYNFLPQSVSGKTVLITGGTTGIGHAIAVLLSAMGAHVMIVGQNGQHLKEALKDINKVATGEVYGLTTDLSTREGIEKVFEKADTVFESLNILINNAALAFGSVTEGDYDNWKSVVDTNLLSYMACSGEAVKRMKGKAGHIVNVGSMSADVREETGSVYFATKAGIQAFSAALRKQINPMGVKVSLVEPGATDTDLQPDDSETKKEKVKNLEMLAADDIALAILYCLMQSKRCDIVEIKVKPHLQLI